MKPTSDLWLGRQAYNSDGQPVNARGAVIPPTFTEVNQENLRKVFIDTDAVELCAGCGCLSDNCACTPG